MATFYKSNKSNGVMVKDSDVAKNENFSFKDLGGSHESSNTLGQKQDGSSPNPIESALMSPSAMRELSQLYNLQGAMQNPRTY